MVVGSFEAPALRIKSISKGRFGRKSFVALFSFWPPHIDMWGRKKKQSVEFRAVRDAINTIKSTTYFRLFLLPAFCVVGCQKKVTKRCEIAHPLSLN